MKQAELISALEETTRQLGLYSSVFDTATVTMVHRNLGLVARAKTEMIKEVADFCGHQPDGDGGHFQLWNNRSACIIERRTLTKLTRAELGEVVCWYEPFNGWEWFKRIL